MSRVAEFFRIAQGKQVVLWIGLLGLLAGDFLLGAAVEHKQALLRNIKSLVQTGSWQTSADVDLNDVAAAQALAARDPDGYLQHIAGEHWSTRDVIIRLQASVLPQGTTVLLGDSLVEGVWSNQFRMNWGECSVLNAGYGGAGVQSITDRAEAVLSLTNPKSVVLIVGLNDALPSVKSKFWAQKYDHLVQLIQDHGASVAVFTIIPPEAGFPRITVSPRSVEQMNNEIREVARRRGAVLIDIAARLTKPDGFATPGTSRDGIHPGADLYRELTARWIPLALNQLRVAPHQAGLRP